MRPASTAPFLLQAGIGYMRVASFDPQTGEAAEGGHRETGRRPS